MSKSYRFNPIRGEYPIIKTSVVNGKRLIQLTSEGYSTHVHHKFTDAFEEWQDHAARVEMEDLLK